MIHVGIDLHTNNMVNVAINGNGKVVREAKLPTSTRSLADFFGLFDDPVQAVVECIPKAFRILAGRLKIRDSSSRELQSLSINEE